MSIFDVISSGVSEAGGSLSRKAKDLTETAKISSEMNKAEGRRQECFRQIGECIYEGSKDGREADYREILSEVREIEAQLDGLRADLRKRKGLVLCPGCGRDVDRSASFCPGCGAPIAAGNVCPACKTPLEPDAKFCIHCGHKAEGQTEGEAAAKGVEITEGNGAGEMKAPGENL